MRTADTTWDLIVIGGGTAGIVACRTAAGYGPRVALVDRAPMGGDCPPAPVTVSVSLRAPVDVGVPRSAGVVLPAD